MRRRARTAGRPATRRAGIPVAERVAGALAVAVAAGALVVTPVSAQAGGGGGYAAGEAVDDMAAAVLRREAPPPPADTLTLERALRIAMARSPVLRRTRADVAERRAARWADWGAFLPTATTNASFAKTDFTTITFLDPEGTAGEVSEALEGKTKSASQSLNVELSLLEGGRRFGEFAAGADEALAAQLRLADDEREVVAGVKVAYFEALKQQELVAIARRQLETRRDELERTRRRYRIAAVDRTDLLGAQVQVERAELRLLDALDQADAARRELRVQIGGGEPGVMDGPFALAAAGPAPRDEGIEGGRLARVALETSPELAALEAEAEAATSRLWTERGRYLPDITASWTANRSETLGPEGEFLNFDPQSSAQTFGVRASWQLFNGFQRREQTASASAARDRARADLALRRLEIRRDVEDLVDEVRRRARRLEILERTFRVAEERLALTRERFRTGAVEFFDLQQAIQEQIDAESDLVRERHDYRIALARLERWVGRLPER